MTGWGVPSKLPGKGLDVVEIIYSELLWPIAAPERLESCDGDTGSARHELEEPQALLVVEALYGLPKPQHHRMHCVVACRGGGGWRVKYGSMWEWLVGWSQVSRGDVHTGWGTG